MSYAGYNYDAHTAVAIQHKKEDFAIGHHYMKNNHGSAAAGGDILAKLKQKKVHWIYTY